jgi:hypothetical protein
MAIDCDSAARAGAASSSSAHASASTSASSTLVLRPVLPLRPLPFLSRGGGPVWEPPPPPLRAAGLELERRREKLGRNESK